MIVSCVKFYILTIINMHECGGPHGITTRLRGYTRQKKIGNIFYRGQKEN